MARDFGKATLPIDPASLGLALGIVDCGLVDSRVVPGIRISLEVRVGVWMMKRTDLCILSGQPNWKTGKSGHTMGKFAVLEPCSCPEWNCGGRAGSDLVNAGLANRRSAQGCSQAKRAPTARFATSSRAQAKGGLADTHSPHQEPHFPRCVGSNQHARKDPQLREIPLHMGMRCNLGEPGRTVEPGRKVSAMPLMPQFIPALLSDAHELMLSRFCGHFG
jgi:hypothetical protein